MIGRTVSHYRVLEKLGAGGMGDVYLAHDTALDRRVAVKFLSERLERDAVARQRFLMEARSAAALDHPFICSIHELGDVDGDHFIVMEYVEGRTLAERLTHGRLSPDEAQRIGVEIAEALEKAHHNSIVHRDLKPGNVMLTPEGHVKVMDFGLAKQVRVPDSHSEAETPAALTREGTTPGTLLYMSPEQVMGSAADARSDLFSFGVLLYELLTGVNPFRRSTGFETANAIVQESAPPLAEHGVEASPKLQTILDRMLAKDPDRRYQRAREIATDLEEAGDSPERDATMARPVFAGVGRRFGRLALVVLVGALAFIAALVGVLLWSSKPVTALAETDVIVLTDFVNDTGDDVFDGTLREALAIKLEESPFLNVASSQRVQETLAFMNRSPDEPITREVGREICRRLALKALMTGEIAQLGSAYVITLGAENCATGDRLASEQVQAPAKEQVLASLDRSVSALREKLGESLASVQRLDTPLEQATTASLEALKAFSLGDARRDAGGDREAIPFYQRALELDPDFALAHARLGTVYNNLSEFDRSVAHRERAFALRERVSERERLYITAHYYASVRRELDKARATYELWRETYPRDVTPLNNLGILYQTVGEPERALAAYLDAIELDPQTRLPYANAFGIGTMLGRIDDVRIVVDRYASARGEDNVVHRWRFQLAFVDGDEEAMARHAAALSGTEDEAEFLGTRAAVEVVRGRFEEARELKRREIALWSQRGLSERAGLERASLGVLEATLGYRERARDVLETALELSTGPGASFISAFGFARIGEPDRAEEAIAARGLPLDEISKAVFLGALQAEIALRRKEFDVALGHLVAAAPYEQRHEGGFNVIYLRGEIYLAMGRGAEAALEFGKILDQPHRTPLDVAHRLAPLGLARALVLTGDTDGARRSYESFFSGWRDAPPGVPILEQARAEYDALL